MRKKIVKKRVCKPGREPFWNLCLITSKLRNSFHARDSALRAFDETMRKLGVEQALVIFAAVVLVALGLATWRMARYELRGGD